MFGSRGAVGGLGGGRRVTEVEVKVRFTKVRTRVTGVR